MTVISGASPWRLTIRRNENSVAILRAVSGKTDAILPDELFSLPVTAIADHALSPSSSPVAGEEILISCGPEPEEYDNRSLRSLVLPSKLERIERYAFMNCRNLKSLYVPSSLSVLSAGAFMNCISLYNIYICNSVPSQNRAMALLCEELANELDVRLLDDGSRTYARLIFPEFTEILEEIFAAHHFEYSISGAGYPYHHVFQQKRFDFRDYDMIWSHYLSLDHSADTALSLAWRRLRYPFALSSEADAAYRDYISDNMSSALTLVLNEHDMPALHFLLSLRALTDAELSDAQTLSRNLGFTEAIALFLEKQHKSMPAARSRSFDL